MESTGATEDLSASPPVLDVPQRDLAQSFSNVPVPVSQQLSSILTPDIQSLTTARHGFRKQTESSNLDREGSVLAPQNVRVLFQSILRIH